MFDPKTGKFMPLTEIQLARFDDEQRAAYDELESVAAALDAANREAADAIAANHAAVAALDAAEKAEAKKPKWTFLDELRATQAQWREDHR